MRIGFFSIFSGPILIVVWYNKRRKAISEYYNEAPPEQRFGDNYKKYGASCLIGGLIILLIPLSVLSIIGLPIMVIGSILLALWYIDRNKNKIDDQDHDVSMRNILDNLLDQDDFRYDEPSRVERSNLNTINCPNCGFNCQSDDSFCGNCGRFLQI